MRTTIDSKYNFQVASGKPSSPSKSAADESRSMRFDDALKAADPKSSENARKAPESRATDSKKTNATQKKDAALTQKSDDAEHVEEHAESIEGGEDEAIEMPTLDDAAGDSNESSEPESQSESREQDSSDSGNETDTAETPTLLVSVSQPQVASDDAEVASELIVAIGDSSQVQLNPKPLAAGTAQKSAAGEQITVPSTDSENSDFLATTSPPIAPDGTPPVEDEKTASEADAGSAEQSKSPEAATTTSIPLPEKSSQSSAEFSQNQSPQIQAAGTTPNAKPADIPQPPLQPSAAQDIRFADNNHPQIISGIRGELLPDGGKMTLKLDPPELGALQVQVHLRDGVMTATFQTSNDDATRMLSHSLSSLKSALESQGINVEKLQVQQAPKDQQSGMNQDTRDQSQQSLDNQSARQEQQRREMLQRMWRKLSGAEDPLDLVA